MKLNGRLLRARRMELGLTSREIARSANVSQGLIKRLEDTGDASVLQVETLSAILASLSLDLIEAIEEPPTREDADSDLIAEIGGFLHERKRGVMPVEIASTLGVTLDRIGPTLDALDRRLRPLGLRIHRTSTGASIVPSVRANMGSGSTHERLRYLSNLNSGDLALLYRTMTTGVPVNTVAATANGNVSLQKLEGAGLAVVEGKTVRMTSEAAVALME